MKKLKFMKKLNWLCLSLVFLFFACGKSDEDRLEEQIMQIKQYLDDNGLTAEVDPSGLHYVITETGNGRKPTFNNEVEVNYKGYLLDGQVFDENPSAEFSLLGVIRGWQIGIPLFDERGKGILLIPSYLGYGDNPPPNSIIPEHSILIFDIEILDVD